MTESEQIAELTTLLRQIQLALYKTKKINVGLPQETWERISALTGIAWPLPQETKQEEPNAEQKVIT